MSLDANHVKMSVPSSRHESNTFEINAENINHDDNINNNNIIININVNNNNNIIIIININTKGDINFNNSFAK